MSDRIELCARKRLGEIVEARWRLDRLLGIGGSAAVYAATHRNGYRVAIKILHRSHAESRRAAPGLLREARIVNSVRHPGVVAAFELGARG